MRTPVVLMAVVLAFTTTLHAADQLADKTPAYFIERYGAPVESGPKNECSLYLAEALPRKVNVSGQFLVLKFQAEALTVEVVYLLPGHTLAAVTYQRPRMWTPAQTQAIVMTYSEDWSRVRNTGRSLAYRTAEETLSLTGINTLAIQTQAGSLAAQRPN